LTVLISICYTLNANKESHGTKRQTHRKVRTQSHGSWSKRVFSSKESRVTEYRRISQYLIIRFFLRAY